MKTVVMGLGNTLLTDDGVGIYTARALKDRLGKLADVIEAELAGLDLIEKFEGYDRAYIIDAIQLKNEEPGTVFRMRPDDVRVTPRLASFHDVDLVSAMELGRRLKLMMPKEVFIYAIQVADAHTLSERCLPPVERVISALADEIAGEIKGGPFNRISKTLAERKGKTDARALSYEKPTGDY
jgi:hydrogenase maturation protease